MSSLLILSGTQYRLYESQVRRNGDLDVLPRPLQNSNVATVPLDERSIIRALVPVSQRRGMSRAQHVKEKHLWSLHDPVAGSVGRINDPVIIDKLERIEGRMADDDRVAVFRLDRMNRTLYQIGRHDRTSAVMHGDDSMRAFDR